MLACVEAAVVHANNMAVSRAQRIQKWAFLLNDFTLPGGELGMTLLCARLTRRPDNEAEALRGPEEILDRDRSYVQDCGSVAAMSAVAKISYSCIVGPIVKSRLPAFIFEIDALSGGLWWVTVNFEVTLEDVWNVMFRQTVNRDSSGRGCVLINA